MTHCAHFLVWLVGLLVLDYVVHKLNPARHEKLHLWKTYLACWIVLGETLLCQIFSPLLSWGYMPYGICSVPLMVRCTSRLIHGVPMMRGRLTYHEWLLVSRVGPTVYGCNQIIQICEYRLIGEEEFLIVWENLGWLLLAVIIHLTV